MIELSHCARAFKLILKKTVPGKTQSKIKKFYRFIDHLAFKSKVKKQFYNIHGYKLNLKKPRSLSEKIVWKKLYDRNPLIPLSIDKYKARAYIKSKLGREQAKEHLIPLLYVIDEPEKIPFDLISEECIIKPNHASSRYIIVEINDGNKLYTVMGSPNIYTLADSGDSRVKIIELCHIWMNKVYGLSKHEWGYKKIKPLIVVEKLLKDNGKLPYDYKFFMFHGKCKMILVRANNLSSITKIYLDQKWNILPISRGKDYRQFDYIERPAVLEKMISLAEKLSEDFNFVRIDLYLVNKQIYCGEITHYPSSGLLKFTPTEFDFEIGKHWDIHRPEKRLSKSARKLLDL